MAKKSAVHAVPCTQEKRIDSIELKVTSIEGSLNGTEGLMAIVVKQAEITQTQGENIDKVMTMVDILRVKDIETDKEKEVKVRMYKQNESLKKEKRIQRKYYVGTIITIFALILAYLRFIN